MPIKPEEIQLLFTRRNARSRGSISSEEYNDSIEELAHDLLAFNSQWNQRIVPLTSAIPDGTDDVNVNAFSSGLSGKTLYAASDASSTLDAKYYNSTSARPKTVFEQFEGMYYTIDLFKEEILNSMKQTTVSARDVPIEDIGGTYNSTNVETALQEVMAEVNQVNFEFDFNAITTSLIPDQDNAYDIGTDLFRWRDLKLGPASLNILSTAAESGGTPRSYAIGINATGQLVVTEDATEVMTFRPDGKTQVNEVLVEEKSSAPSATVGFGTLYTLSADNKLYFKTSAGVTSELTGVVTEANVLELSADSDDNEASSAITLSVDGSEMWKVNTDGHFSAENGLSRVLAGDGVEATPTYSFFNDDNTGMWSPSGDQIAFSVNASEIIRINATGIGIGTDTPSHSLTFVNTATGAVFYNTVDQVTNYERVKLDWGPSSRFTIGTEKDGSGAARDISIAARAATLWVSPNQSGLTTPTEMARQLVVEGSSNTGITIAAPNTDYSSIVFADQDDSYIGGIIYDHNEDHLYLSVNNLSRWSISSVGTLTSQNSSSIRNSSGSVGSPSYSFIGDTNTGIWHPAADALGFAIGGRDLLKLRRWEVESDPEIGALFGGSQFGTLLQGEANGKTLLGLRNNDNSDSFSIISTSGPYTTDADYDTVIAHFQADGKVGIGTESPAYALDIETTAANRQARILYPSAADGNYMDIAIGRAESESQCGLFGFKYDTTTDDVYSYIINYGDTFPTGLFVRKGGNVGIGTTAPLGSIHIAAGTLTGQTPYSNANSLVIDGTGDTGLNILSGDASYGRLAFGDDADPYIGSVAYSHGSNKLFLYSNNTTSLTCAGDKVGIGTDSPTEKLEVYTDSDNSGIIGRAHIGFVSSGTSDRAYFSHVDHADSTGYALRQSNAGLTTLNSNGGQDLQFAVDNVNRWRVGPDGHFSAALPSSYQILAPGCDASGPSYSFASDTDTGMYLSSGIMNFATGGVKQCEINSTGIAVKNNGWIHNGNGFAANPGYSFTDDIDTGMYRISEDILGFAAGTVEGMRITETGLATTVNVSNILEVDNQIEVPSSSDYALQSDETYYISFNPILAQYSSSSLPASWYIGSNSTRTFSGDAGAVYLPLVSLSVGHTIETISIYWYKYQSTNTTFTLWRKAYSSGSATSVATLTDSSGTIGWRTTTMSSINHDVWGGQSYNLEVDPTYAGTSDSVTFAGVQATMSGSNLCLDKAC